MNVVKTIGIVLAVGKKQVTGRFNPCGVCQERVVCNSIVIHRFCLKISRRFSLSSVKDTFVYRTCTWQDIF